MFCVAVVVAALAIGDLGTGAVALASIFVLAGVARVAYWRLHLGRRHLRSTDDALVFVGPSGVVREARWADVTQVRLSPAPRYSEWMRMGATSTVFVAERDALAPRGPCGEFAAVLTVGAERQVLWQRLVEACHRHRVPVARGEQES